MKKSDFIDKKFKCAIFDLDGTCLDSMWLWEDVDRQFLTKRGIEVPNDYLEAIATMGFKSAAVYTIDRFGFNETPDELMEEWTKMALDRYATEVKPKKNVVNYLKILKKENIKIVAATASFREMFMPALDNCRMTELFDGFVTVGDVGKTKAFPDVYLKAAQIGGVKPCDCVVFEDVLEAVSTAKKAGFFTVAVKEKTAKRNEAIIKEISDIYIEEFGDFL